MKLTRKLTLLIALAVWSVISLVAIFRIVEERELFRDDVKRDHEVLGYALSAAVSEAWRESGQAIAKDVVSHSNTPASAVQVKWVDLNSPEGTSVLATADLQRLRAGNLVHTIREAAVPALVTFVSLRTPNDTQAALELSETLAGEARYRERTVSHTIVVTLAVGFVCTALAFALGTWMVGRPIRALRDKARRVGTGDLDTPVLISQRDELGELASDMNLMSEELARARRTSEQAIQDKLSALEQLRHAERLATVGRLAAGVAHELGTPLHVVLGHTKMLESGEVSTPVDIIDSLQTIRRQSERMTTIIRQLLDFSRSRKPNKTRVDLVRIAREAANMLSAMASKHGIRLEVLGNSEGLFASVDESQVLQVLTNLLKNSVDATTSQAPVTVRVSAAERDASKPDEKMLRIDVIDHGSGISAEVREHLFEPFFTTKDVGAGSGLGLAVSHGIIQEHGGEIRVESAPDGGSVFTVLLPAEGACLPA